METILQIGEGNFLRAFAENYLQDAVDKGYGDRVVICQPRSNTKVINALKKQNCEYDIIVRGRLNGEIINERKHINCVSRCMDTVDEYGELRKLFCSEELKIVISNTTEAGIRFDENDIAENSPNVSFPAKVTALLRERFINGGEGLVFLPVELIEQNGDMLRECIIKYAELWKLGDEFISYVENECSFCNTLVDRIVTGHIAGDPDPCSCACEPYRSWIVQADERAKAAIPFENIIYTDDLVPYRTRKVRILNGAHTMSVLAAHMAGFDIVRDMMNDALFGRYIQLGLEEIKSTIDLPRNELDEFANGVSERFNNPFIDHRLLDISLNSVSKFRARCLDTVIDYYKSKGALPKILTFSLAALIAFYLKIGDREYEVNDGKEVLDFFAEKPGVREILSNVSFWGRDLTEINGFAQAVEHSLESICKHGIINAVKEVVNG